MKLTDAILQGKAIKTGEDVRVIAQIDSLEVDIPVNKLFCSHNQLTSLVLNHPVNDLYCSHNQLTSLVLNHPVNNLFCGDNQLASLVLNHPVNILDCWGNRLTSLTLNYPINDLYCSHNQLTSLVLNHPVNDLYCPHNQLTSLVLNHPVNNLFCGDNQLASLVLNHPVNNLNCSYNQLTSLPKHKRMNDGDYGDNWIYADGILMEVVRKRKVGEYTIYYSPFEMVCATKDGKVFAHGKNSHEAIQDLAFKYAKRNMDDYKSLTLDSVVSYDEAIILYRVITDACRIGTNQFLTQTKPEKRDYTIREILEKTKGQYGHEKLEEFFTRPAGGSKQ